MLKIQSLFARFLYAFFNFTLRCLQAILFAKVSDPKTILILRAGHLGDTLCAVPALLGIEKRFPNARRILLTNAAPSGLPAPADVLGGLVRFDRVMTYDPGSLRNPPYVRELIRKIRGEKIDLAIYLGQSIASFTRVLRDLIFFKSAGCRSAFGFQVDTHRYFVLAQRYHRTFLQESDRLLALLKPLGISGKPDIKIPESDRSILKKLPSKRPLIAIHSWAKYPVKRWPLERFAEVGKALQDRYQASIIIVGGNDAKENAKSLLRALNGDAVDFTGETGFLETAEVLRHCDLFLSNDTGPVHIAAGAGTPVVGIYSARDFPNAWYPAGSGHETLRKDVPCQICYLETCPIMICINRIGAGEVLAACERILSRKFALERE